MSKPLNHRISEYVARINLKLKGLDKVYLFGSTAKGTRLKDSDVDMIFVSKTFKEMPLLKRLGFLQNEWDHDEELQALAYTPEEFERVSKRWTMRELLGPALDLTPKAISIKCPKCGEEGSLQMKTVKARANTYRYYYYAHYQPNRKGLKWCYVGKEPPKSTRPARTAAK